MNQRIAKLCLVFILLLAAVLRSADLTQPIWQDEALYAHTARNFYRTQHLTFDGAPWSFQPPFFIFFLTFFYFILGDSEFVARISGPLLGTLGVLGVYLLAKHLYDEETGLLASLFIAIMPAHVFFARMILADNLLATSLIFTLFFFLKYVKENQKKYLYASSIFIAVTALSKKIGVLVYPSLILYLFLKEKNSRWIKRKDIWLIFLISILIQVPWYIRNYFIFNNPFINFTPLLTFTNPPLYPRLPFDELEENSIFRLIDLISYVAGLPVFLISIVGILLLLKDKKEILLPGIFLGSFLSVAILFSGTETGRYILPALSFFSMFAGYGMRKFSEKRIYYPLFILLLFSTFLFNVDFSIEVIKNNREKYTGYKETGEWLKEYSAKNATLITNSRVLRYYSEKYSIYFPEKEEEFWNIVKNYSGELYIVVEDWTTDPPTPVYAKENEKKLKNQVYAFAMKQRKIIRVYKNE